MSYQKRIRQMEENDEKSKKERQSETTDKKRMGGKFSKPDTGSVYPDFDHPCIDIGNDFLSELFRDDAKEHRGADPPEPAAD